MKSITKGEKKIRLKRLRTKILVIIALPVIIAFLIAGILTTNSARASIYSLPNDELATTFKAVSYRIDGKIEPFSQLVKDMAANEQFRKILSDTQKGSLIAEAESFAQATDTMISLVKTNESILST